MKHILGIDIGGSGIKGAPVDLKKGKFAAERLRIETPQPSKPKAVAKVVGELVKHFDYKGPIGCTFPAVIQRGVALSAANVDKSWIGTDAATLFREQTGCPMLVLNDADAAGYAEMKHGAGKGRDGVVIMLTFGTGIGTAVFLDGKLLPNTEFGHVEIRGKDAEHRASANVRKEKDLSWKEWAKRVEEYLQHMEMLLTPDLFIIGGGVSKRHEKFLPLLGGIRAEIVPAELFNDAGIVGAAMAAREMAE